MTSKICKVMYINLNHRTDRNSQVQAELKKVFPEDKIIKQQAVYTPYMSGIGCAHSHINCIQYAISNNFDNILIVEDDFMFTLPSENVEEKINHLYESTNNFQNFDICLFSHNLLKSEKIDEHISRIYDAQTTSCYLLNKKFYTTLLKNFQEAKALLSANTRMYDKYAIDQYWKKLMSNYVFIGFTPALGKQRPSYSDIEHKFVTPSC